MKKIGENTKVALTLKQLKRLVKESYDETEAYTVRNTMFTFSNSDQSKEYGTYRTEEDAEKMRRWLARKDPSWKLENTEVVPKELDPMLPVHWTNVDDLEDDMDEGCKTQVNEGPGAGYTVKMTDITLLNVTATVADGAWTVKGDCKFTGYAEGYDWSTEELEYEGLFQFHVNTHQINKYVEKFLPDWDSNIPEEGIKEMLERTSAYSIEDINQMIGAGWSHVKWDGVLEVDQAGFDLDDRYLSGHDAEVGNFDIELYDKGSSSGEVNDCYFSITCDDFALDVETAYEMKDEEDEPLDEAVKESNSENEVIARKKDAIRKAKARIDELNNIIGMVLEEIEEVEGAIDSGEIDGQEDERGYINASEHLVQIFTDLRSAVVGISGVNSKLSKALISICNGFKMNHGSLVHGMRTNEQRN